MRKINCLGVLIGSLMQISLNAAAGLVADEFAIITQKNVFRLSPSIRPAKPGVAPPELPQFCLQGIITILGPRQALLKTQTKTNPGTTEVTCILAEGQVRDGVVVTRIDVDSGTVWLTNQGTEQILKIKE